MAGRRSNRQNNWVVGHPEKIEAWWWWWWCVVVVVGEERRNSKQETIR